MLLNWFGFAWFSVTWAFVFPLFLLFGVIHNSSTFYLASKSVFHVRTKNIEVDFNLILQKKKKRTSTLIENRLFVMSRKSEVSTHDVLFDKIKTKLLISNSKPWIHEGFLWIHKEIKIRLFSIPYSVIWQNFCIYW